MTTNQINYLKIRLEERNQRELRRHNQATERITEQFNSQQIAKEYANMRNQAAIALRNNQNALKIAKLNNATSANIAKLNASVNTTKANLEHIDRMRSMDLTSRGLDLQANKQKYEIANLQAQTNLNEANAALAQTNAQFVQQQTKTERFKTALTSAQFNTEQQRGPNINADTGLKQSQTNLNTAKQDEVTANIKEKESKTKINDQNLFLNPINAGLGAITAIQGRQAFLTGKRMLEDVADKKEVNKVSQRVKKISKASDDYKLSSNIVKTAKDIAAGIGKSEFVFIPPIVTDILYLPDLSPSEVSDYRYLREHGYSADDAFKKVKSGVVLY